MIDFKSNEQIKYILKIIIGAIIIASATTITLLGSPFQLPQWISSLLAIGTFTLILPVSYLIYSKMDELQKKLHEHASLATLTLVIVAMGITGVLQSNDIIPLFNQVWVLIAGILIWAIALVFSDRFYK